MKTIRIAFIALSLIFVSTTAAMADNDRKSLNQITGEELTRNGDTDILRALRGRVAGLNITRETADPFGMNAQMRGTGSLVCNQSPLFIVDGMSVESLDIVSIYDVDTIVVLKNNEASAIYGSRAAGGAIVVTTKRQ